MTWNGKATLVLRAGLEPGEATLAIHSAFGEETLTLTVK